MRLSEKKAIGVAMTPFPVKEIESKELYETYSQNNGPFCVQEQGRPDLVVMSTSDFAEMDESLSEDDVASIRLGLEQIQRGEGIDAREALAQVRAKYGL